MTLYNLITFCQKNRVEVSLGFDPTTENVVVKMRRDNLFQVDYGVPHPDTFHSSEDWEHMVVMMLSGMVRQLEMQENQRNTRRGMQNNQDGIFGAEQHKEE